MMKKFWIFRAGDHFELWETVFGGPLRASSSRGVRDTAKGLNAVKSLAESVVKVSGRLQEAISVSFEPHPWLRKKKPRFYRPLTAKEKQQAIDVFEKEFEDAVLVKSPPASVHECCIDGVSPCKPNKHSAEYCAGCGG